MQIWFNLTLILAVLKVFSLTTITWLQVFIPAGIGIVIALIWGIYKGISLFNAIDVDGDRISVDGDGNDITITKNGRKTLIIRNGKVIYRDEEDA